MKIYSNELDQALECVRFHQKKRFVELMRGLTMDEHASTIDATNIMSQHGGQTVTLTFSAETAILLSHILSSIDVKDYPGLEKARQNYVAAVCHTVERVSPVLAAVAQGQLKTHHLVCPKQTSS